MPAEETVEHLDDGEFEELLASELDMTVAELRERSDELPVAPPWEADVVEEPE